MRVFISWSGSRSHEIALALRDWLPTVLPGAEPWVSSEDIDKGARWTVELGRELDAARFAILCLVPENLGEPWVIFEAGAMSRSIETARVAPLLVGAAIKDVPGPLGQFQCTAFEKEDVRRLMRSINRALGEPVDRGRLDEAFEQRWPELEACVEAIEVPPRAAPERDPSPIVEEPGFARPATLPQEQVKILRVLARNPGTSPGADQLAYLIGENQTRTQYHLDRLRGEGLINHRLNATRPPAYYLTEDGRAYVVENNLDRI
jgi:hypothetical protein